jgi:hypothetical protein
MPLKAAAALFVLTAALGCRARSPTAPGAPPSEGPDAGVPVAGAWFDFWRAQKVSPPPPRNFLDVEAPAPLILNLTNGLVPDEVVRTWVMADLRSGRGATWAAAHLRLDVANAGVLGSPGLNGTSDAIAKERAKGALEVSCPADTALAAAVVATSRDMRRRIAWAGLTNFVIVQTVQASGEPCKRILVGGKTEAVPARRARAELSWQLDTGELRNDPVVGPLWYQARGWPCKLGGAGALDEICSLLQP